MAFKTYQAEQYKTYIQQHEKTLDEIYKYIHSSPVPYSYLVTKLNIHYATLMRKKRYKSFTAKELITLLDLIK